MDNLMKTCSKCEKPKEISEFYKNKATNDGLQYICKSCTGEHNNSPDHKEYFKTPEFKQRSKIYGKTYRASEQGRQKREKNYLKLQDEGYYEAYHKKPEYKEYQKEWNISPSGKASFRKYSQNNKPKFLAKTRKRQLKKLQRTPIWLTKGDWIEIEWAYEIAAQMTKETGIPYEVDHIIPLQGKSISGLHVPQNLRVITATENRIKHNRWSSK